jgi:hypothetical protein
MKHLMFLLMALTAAVPAAARLGETAEACAARYGVHGASTVQDQFMVRQYARKSIAIQVYFVQKREKLFTYTDAVGVIYTRPGKHWRDGNQPLTSAAIDALLAANTQDHSWQEINLIKMAAEADESETEAALEAARDWRLWRRDDGVVAHYMRHTHELVLRSDAKVPLPKPLAVKEAEATVLDGF